MKKLEELILNDNGKDDRLKILENGMTKYGCKPYPYPHLSYSSCTASTISLEAFIHLKEYLKNKNLNNKEIYLNELQLEPFEMSGKVTKIIDLDAMVEKADIKTDITKIKSIINNLNLNVKYKVICKNGYKSIAVESFIKNYILKGK